MEKSNYSFTTAISMVVGIVIGSGIFFKADDILSAVGGNVLYGLLGFVLVGIGVLFGALTVTYYAHNDQEHIGMIGYAKQAVGNKFAYIVGWFSISCYFPALIVILAMVAAIYLGVLLNIQSQLFITVATIVFLVASFTINIRSPKNGGRLQVIFTIAKLTPLLVMGVIGTLFFTDIQTISTTASTTSNASPLSALIAIAFAFDGWIVATNISKDLKNPKRDLPRALALGALVIISVYMLYFFGVTQLLDPETIMVAGDAHTEMAAAVILGPIGGKLITLFIIVSVYGGLNGMTLAYLRLPKLMDDANLIKSFKNNDSSKLINSETLFCLVSVSIYVVIQNLLDYNILFSNLENGFDISTLPIILNYILYIVLFLSINKFTFKEDNTTTIRYLVYSVIASITALIVVYGALQVNGLIYCVFTIVILLLGIPFYKKYRKRV